MHYKLLLLILLVAGSICINAQNKNLAPGNELPGRSLNFDGIDDQVIVPNYPELQLKNGTLEASIKIIDSTDFEWHAIVSKTLAYQVTLKYYRIATFDWVERKMYVFGNSLNDGRWHHVAFVFQENIENGSQLYLDGEPIGPPITYHMVDNGSELAIGGNHFTDQYFNGNIDEVRVWNSPLPAEEIKEHYQTEIPYDSKGLVLYYKFNEGISAGNNEGFRYIKDETLNKLDAPLRNFALQGKTSNYISETVIAPYHENLLFKFIKENKWTIFWSTLVFFCGLIGYRWRLRYLENKNKDLEAMVKERTGQLAKMLEEKDVLIQEIHHRVKNNLQFILSIIDMQMMVNLDQDNTALDDVARRLSAMALVHELLYRQDNIELVSAKTYFDAFMENIKKIIASSTTVLKYDIADVQFNVSQCMSIGMIMSELISNSIKYAFTRQAMPEMQVKLIPLNDGKNLILTYSDNGVGFDDSAINKGLGSTLIDAFSQQLKGSYSYKNVDGVLFTLKFSL